MSIMCVVKLKHKINDTFFLITDSGLEPFDNIPSEKEDNTVKESFKRCIRISMDGYLLSCIKDRLETSPVYRSKVLEYFTKLSKDTNLKIIVKLVQPQQHILDYKWYVLVS